MSRYNQFLVFLVLFAVSLCPLYRFEIISNDVGKSLFMLSWALLLVVVTIRSIHYKEINIGGGACTRAQFPKIYWISIVIGIIFDVIYVACTLMNIIVTFKY
jgi:hypothetical protein